VRALVRRQPWTNSYDTSNYVLYQRDTTRGVTRQHPSEPNACLVMAEGSTRPDLALGLGAVHPACYVSHFGFRTDDAGVVLSDNSWTQYSSTTADEGINLVRF
jgi:hypothetical protein